VKKRKSVADEASTLVNGPRGENYGHPLDDFTRTAQMWSALFGIPVTAEQVALAMVCVKLSREAHTPHPTDDNVIDAMGYLVCHRMVQDERVRRGS